MNGVGYQQIQSWPTPFLFLTDDMRIFRADNVDLVAGIGTVAEPRVTVNTICIYARRTVSGSAGAAITYAITPGVGVQFNGNDAADNGQLSYILLEKIT